MKPLNLKILIRGAGEMASGVAHRLFQSHFYVLMTEIPMPLSIRRAVCFSEAVFEEEAEVEGVVAVRVESVEEIEDVWDHGRIAVLVDPDLNVRRDVSFDVVVDATLAKRNIGTFRGFAPFVIGLGPGFMAGEDVDCVIETNRGHHLGRVIYEGAAEPNTGIPGSTLGYTVERVLRAPADGVFKGVKTIGDQVVAGETVRWVSGVPMISQIDGVLRGILRDGMTVTKGMKSGDVDPRGQRINCFTISDKARAVAGSVLEVILHRFNR
jgi:xanthine dehydrogenase accessory factor